MKKYCILLACMAGCGTLFSQAPEEPSRIGTQLQDLTVRHIVNYNTTEAKISDFHKNKLLLLDFFATWCHPCVAELPKMDQLQAKFKDHLQLVAVTDQSEETIQNFLATKKIGTALPFITRDVSLNEQFRHTLIPHVVWINPSGKVIAITSNKEVTEENIELALKQEQVGLEEKKDVLRFSRDRPLFFDGNGGDGTNFLYRSLLLKADKGLPSGGYAAIRSLDEEPLKINRYVAFNRKPLNLFVVAFSKGNSEGTARKRLILDLTDTFAYTGARGLLPLPQEMEAFTEWFWKHACTYEYIVPDYISDTLFFSQMLEDLNKYFPLKARVVQKKAACLVLKRISQSEELLKTEGKKPAMVRSAEGRRIKKMENTTLDKFVAFLNRFQDIDPVINETGFKGRVDLELDIQYGSEEDFFDHLDLPSLRLALKKYGLDLVPEKRQIDMLLLSDKDRFLSKMRR